MKNDTILALQGPTGTQSDLDPLVNATFAQNGRLSVLHIGPVPLLAAFSIGATPYAVPIVPDIWVNDLNEMAETLSVTQAKTREYLQKQGVTGEVATLCVEPAALHDLVAARAVFADLCVVQNSLRENKNAFDNVVYGLLFEGPGPVMLNVDKNSNALAPKSILVGWNNSLSAARAVRAALPMLKNAENVTVACIDPTATKWADGENPGADLASWLSHHGCRVTVQEFPTGGKTVSEVILEHAVEQGADLVVMGAYGHNRLNEKIFGGTTQSMIQQQDLPVFFVH
ncbi:MAG: nucleotide-binding universal stress UspA family protein [Yoonia sp.]|jgi:nucleotide-binding universal stress UspA family protein